VRIEGENWWFAMRKSGTESAEICRLCVESDGDRKLMEQKRDALVELVGPQYRI
jgi:phosphomannomutase